MKTRCFATLLILSSFVLGVSGAVAQVEEGTPGTQDQTQERQRLMERIENDPNLDPGQRERMRENLRQCEQLGLSPEELNSLFPDASSQYGPEARLQIQSQVMELAREGRPVDLVCDKLDEGQMKGASELVLLRATERVGANLRYAHRYLENAKQDGISGMDNPSQEQALVRGVALNRWRGLEDGEFEHLQEQARVRARDGSCTLTDLCAATETATELREMGVDSQRNMKLCGDALQQGYHARELRQLAWMVGEAHQRGGNPDAVCDELHLRVRERQQLGEMVHHMQGEGWLGPESMGHGHGGHSPVDDVMGGGHHGDEGGMGGHGSGSGGGTGGGHGGGGHGGGK